MYFARYCCSAAVICRLRVATVSACARDSSFSSVAMSIRIDPDEPPLDPSFQDQVSMWLASII
ncbi:hypothetical protein CWS35_11025 [Bradyrhizobium sp. SK17]|nr:hypothetical protein CWS35_11025 [Bradyrhizobium sp. SK17]